MAKTPVKQGNDPQFNCKAAFHIKHPDKANVVAQVRKALIISEFLLQSQIELRNGLQRAKTLFIANSEYYFLKPFLKGKILRSSERGVNSILTTILRF